MQDVTEAESDEQRWLSAVKFQHLARVPAAVEWFANLDVIAGAQLTQLPAYRGPTNTRQKKQYAYRGIGLGQ